MVKTNLQNFWHFIVTDACILAWQINIVRFWVILFVKVTTKEGDIVQMLSVRGRAQPQQNGPLAADHKAQKQAHDCFWVIANAKLDVPLFPPAQPASCVKNMP